MQITLVGLDAVNLSLGLALKAAIPELPLVGNDREREQVKAAIKLGAIAKGHWNLLSACDGSDLIIISEPLAQLETDLAALAPELNSQVVVLVLSATQRPVQALLGRLGSRAACLGGRFVAGGLAAGATPAASLLQKALCYIVAAPATPPDAVAVVANLAEAVGARPCFVNAEEHDGIAAATEQLPQALALALLATLSRSGAQRDMQRDLGPALGELMRYAPAPTELDALLANGDNLLYWLEACAASLRQLSAWLVAGDSERIAAEAKAVQQALAAWGKVEEESAPEVTTASSWRQMLLGQWRPRRPS